MVRFQLSLPPNSFNSQRSHPPCTFPLFLSQAQRHDVHPAKERKSVYWKKSSEKWDIWQENKILLAFSLPGHKEREEMMKKYLLMKVINRAPAEMRCH